MEPAISDEKVFAATGKTWPEWFDILLKQKAQQWDHKAIVHYLHTKHHVQDWWVQMVAVTFEQAHGGRKKHEKPGGFEVSVGKTFVSDMEAVWALWENKAKRKKWLGEHPITFRKSTPGKSMRITWDEDQTSLSINVYEKPGGKIQLSVQHGKLKDAAHAEKMKAFWREKLDKLAVVAEN